MHRLLSPEGFTVLHIHRTAVPCGLHHDILMLSSKARSSVIIHHHREYLLFTIGFHCAVPGELANFICSIVANRALTSWSCASTLTAWVSMVHMSMTMCGCCYSHSDLIYLYTNWCDEEIFLIFLHPMILALELVSARLHWWRRVNLRSLTRSL